MPMRVWRTAGHQGVSQVGAATRPRFAPIGSSLGRQRAEGRQRPSQAHELEHEFASDVDLSSAESMIGARTVRWATTAPDTGLALLLEQATAEAATGVWVATRSTIWNGSGRGRS